MTALKRRSRVVLDAKLDRLGNFRSSELGNDAEGEIDSRRDATRSEDIAVTHNAPFLVSGAHERQQV